MFPNRFLIFVTLGLCDFVQTCFILSIGGEESNEIAAWLMRHYGLAGAALYKLGLIAMVLFLVEWLWRRDRRAAGRLANYALILGALPVAYGLFLLMLHFGIHLI